MGFFEGLGNLISGGKIAAGKEQKRAGDEEAAGQLKADQAAFANKENARIGAASQAKALLSGLFGGKYALTPEAAAALAARRQDTSFKHAVVDPSKGAGWGALKTGLVGAGKLAGDYFSGQSLLKGLGVNPQAGGAAPTSLRSDVSQTTLLPEDDPRNWGG